ALYMIILSLFQSLAAVLPRITLFPYTTLFRSVGGDRQARIGGVREGAQVAAPRRAAVGRAPHVHRIDVARPESVRPRHVHVVARSEEHTSELQSLAYLVCRLLLEKKNKNYKIR